MRESISSIISEAKEANTKPRIHPNGFIQLDVGENQRLHVWSDIDLPKPKVSVPIHDHTFSFESNVLVGAIKNIVYEPCLDEEGDFRLFEISPYLSRNRQSLFTLNNDRRYRLEEESSFVISEDDSYTFDPFVLHETVVDRFTATTIKVDPSFDRSRLARVACRFPLYPDDSYKRDQVDEELLWEEIGRVADHLG